ncbi:MAG TPA: hypothetical protein VGN57_03185 [Pirellulaceae bacterium]|jgi:hypothetical protein|nr:hypothetical protein [Pirellulaceae bacterium]
MTYLRQILSTALPALALVSAFGCEDPTNGRPRVDAPFAAEPTNARPIADFPVAAEWSAQAPSGAGPAIVISEARPLLPDARHQEVRLVLINPTSDSIEYYGYPALSSSNPPPPGEILPFYTFERLDDAGVWRPAPVGWCGTGARTLQVPPGHAGEFLAHVEPGKRVRVGVEVTRHSRSGTNISAVWSPAIDLSEESATPATP